MVCPDAAAARAGVRIGQRLATALGICPGLNVLARQATQESAALAQLAQWAGRFTPTVSLAGSTLLLEIGGCQRLFGSLENLRRQACTGLAAQGFSFGHAVAPTPLGARWLARGQSGAVCVQPLEMDAALSRLPVEVPGWPPAVSGRLAAFGLATLGDLRRLPARELRQRLGEEVLEAMARAWGEWPDPQATYAFPEHFAAQLELPGRIEQVDLVAQAAGRLLRALAGWLAVRQQELVVAELALGHEQGHVPTQIVLAPGTPTAEADLLMRLLHEHLRRQTLVAPVERVRLSVLRSQPRGGESGALFGRLRPAETAAACLARIQARLGEDSVRRLQVLPDHRPECAVRLVPLVAGEGRGRSADSPKGGVPAGNFGLYDTSTAGPSPQRPLWLLPRPRPLPEQAGRPVWQGPLQLASRPERIESGWWDADEPEGEGDIQREYFVAFNPRGQCAWIYRDSSGWYLHGLFA